MAAVAYRSASSDQRTTGTSTAPAKPSGVVSGDLLIALAFSDRSGTLAAMTAPSGWTLLDSNTTTNAGFVKIWYKIAGGSEASTYTFADGSGSDSTAIIIAVQNGTFDPADPFFSGPTFASSTTAATAHVAPSVSGVTDGLLITGYFGGSGSNGTRTYTTPSGMTERAECSANLWVVSAADTQTLTSGAATGTKSATCSASVAWVAVSLVVNPLATQQDIAATASTAGAGALTATATRVQPAAESNAGAGALGATATRVVPSAVDEMGASGALSAALAVLKTGTAAHAGAGALTATATQQHRPSASFGGSGSLVASISQDRAASVDLAAAGALGADGRTTLPATSGSGGAGALSATVTRVQFAQVAMAGTAHGSFSLSTTGNADLPAQGVLTASANLTQLATYGAAGAGALEAAASQDMRAASASAGSGVLTVDATREHPVTASLSASGALAADGRRVHPLSASLSGAVSTLGASATRVHAARAAMSATGVFAGRPSSQAGGPLNVSLYAVVSGDLVPLADYQELTISPILNEPGAIDIKYPQDGANFNLLRNNITNDRDLEVEVWISGQRAGATRWIISDSSGDDVDEESVWSFTGVSLNNLLSEIVVFPQAGAEKLELIISAASAGKVIRTVVSQAQARGALAGLTLGFSDTVDSNGIPWANNITTKFSPGATGKSVMDTLVSLGLCEWEITRDRVLKAYNPLGLGIDRTVGTDPIVLRRGQSVSEAPRKHTVRDSYTAMLAAGAEGIYSNTSNADALARRGRRIEGFASANNITDTSAVNGYAQTALNAAASGVMELTQALEFTPGDPRPGTSYLEGDWVYAETRNKLERLRIKQWSLTVNADGPSGTISLGDLISERTAALARRLEAMSNGSATVGTSTSTEDTGIPNAPTGLVVGSDPFVGPNGEAVASITVGWTPVTTNTDGSTATDVSGYRVEWRYDSGVTQSAWTEAGTSVSGNQLIFADVQQGSNIRVRVQAVDNSNNVSTWSAEVAHTVAVDNAPPPIPSTPTMDNFLGVIRVTWDGLSSVGADMPKNFDHVEVHLSTSAVFTPDATTLIGTLNAKGTIVFVDGVYGTAYFARLVSINTAALPSTASGTATATPEKVVGDDVFAGAIGTAQLANAAITNAKIGLLAVNDANIGSINVGKLTAGTFSSSMTLSGVIKTAATGNRMEIDNSGWTAYNSSGVVFARLNITNGTMLMTGQYQTALAGQRIVMNPASAAPDEIRVYPSSTGDYGRIVARTAPADGSAAILIDGGAAAGAGRGRIAAYKSEAAVAWVVNDGGGDIETGYSRTAFSAGQNQLQMWAQDQIAFEKHNGQSLATGSRMFIGWFSGSSGSNCPTIIGNNVDAGVKFDSATVLAVNATGTVFRPMAASAFNVGSSETIKTDVWDIRKRLSPLDVIRNARARVYKYTQEVDEQGDAAPERFGPIAEELPATLITEIPNPGTTETVPAINLADQMGVMWGALGQIQDQQIVSTSGRAVVTSIPAPLGPMLPAGKTVEVPVTWDSTPPAAPTGGFVQVQVSLVWQGKVTAWIKTGSTNATGAVVVLKNISNGSVIPSAAAPITLEVVGLGLFTPPLTD